MNLYPVAIKYMAGGAGTPDFSSPRTGAWPFYLCTGAGLPKFWKGLSEAGPCCGAWWEVIFLPCSWEWWTLAAWAAGWFAVATPVKSFGLEFNGSAILAMAILYIANSLQTIGDISSTTMGGMERMPTDQELQGGIISQGVTSVIGALFGGLSTCSYSQNVGIVTMNKVINRSVFAFAAVVLGVARTGAQVLGGAHYHSQCRSGRATISVFSIIATTGVNMIVSAGPFTMRNRTIVGLAAALGIGVTMAPGCLELFPMWVQNVFGSFAPVGAAVVAVDSQPDPAEGP